MDESVEERQVAWQPLTARGVAAFAQAPLGRLLLVQFVVAVAAAGTMVWFLHAAWFSIIKEAIGELPTQGEIHSGTLDWRGQSPVSLADNHFLAVAVDLKHEGKARSPAHVQVEFGKRDLQVFSLFGFVKADYPKQWVIAFNHAELAPWWGAWSPAILAIAAGIVIGGLLIAWAILATLYSLPVWLIGFFANRDLGFGGSWRLAGAALMPGALLMSLAVLLYGLSVLDLVRLMVAGGIHLVMAWGYLTLSPLQVPRQKEAEVVKGNPFVTPAAARAGSGNEASSSGRSGTDGEVG